MHSKSLSKHICISSLSLTYHGYDLTLPFYNKKVMNVFFLNWCFITNMNQPSLVYTQMHQGYFTQKVMMSQYIRVLKCVKCVG